MSDLPADALTTGSLPRLGPTAAAVARAMAGEFPELGASAEDGVGMPHIIAWNLTQRCNLTCSHCYISAGSWYDSAAELSTGECHGILDQILEVNPNPMLILTGGEPLLRDDLEELAAHASSAGATVVVGTNGTLLSDQRIESLMGAGVTGVAVSVDSLDDTYHDRFRHGHGALRDTRASVERMRDHRLDFVIQMTVTRGNRHELRDVVAWSAERGAVSFNLYFVVPTGRAEQMPGMTPGENDAVLQELVELEREYRGTMMIRSKCQPQLMRYVVEADVDSPLQGYGTRCPCGVHYCRITPEGKVTPCPYMPLEAGDLSEQSFREIWEGSAVFRLLRGGELGGRCGKCEYRRVCGGCRARAYAVDGDFLGPDDSCAYDPPGDRPVLEARAAITYGSSGGALTLPWSPDAEAKLARVPSFVRGVVSSRVESFARERGYLRVDAEVMAEVRSNLPVDFSKRLPFFLRGSEEA